MTTLKRLGLLIPLLGLAAAACTDPAPAASPDVLTATGLTPEENLRKYGIPAIVLPCDYPVPEGMIEDPGDQKAMIERKIAHLQAANRLFWGEAPGTPQDRQAVLDEIWTAAEEYFVAFDGLETDWEAFYTTTRDQIGQVESYGEYLGLLTRLAYLLGEGHTYITTGRFWTAFMEKGLGEEILHRPVPGFFPRASDSSIGACVTVTSEEALVVSRIWEGSPNPYRFQVGDEIVGLNGVPWEAWIPRLETAGIPIYGSGDGAETARRYTLLGAVMQNAHLFETINIRRAGSGEVETLPLVFIESEGNGADATCPDWTETQGLVSVQNPGKTLSWQDDPILVHGIIEKENVGYIYLKHLDPEDPSRFADRFEEAVLSLMDTQGLILDLRGNGGGEFPSPLFPGLSHLVRGTEDRQFYGTAVNDPASRDRTRLVPIEEGWGEACQHAAGDDRFDLKGLCHKALDEARFVRAQPFPADDPDLYYRQPIVVLVGPGCASACDQLVHLLSQFPEFTLVGREPNGSLTSPLNWDRVYAYPQMEDAVMLKIPAVASYALDGEAVRHLCRRTRVVDVEVWSSREDVVNGVDAVRERALRIVRESGGSGHQRPDAARAAP